MKSSIIVRETKLKGCLIIQSQTFVDKRGYFVENYNERTFKELTKLEINFVQDNESCSSKGVLRGIHYQIGDYAQAKLVRVTRGKVLDIIVDLRKDSLSFGEHFTIELSGENRTQVFIPRGFGHGFLVLEDNTIFSYKCDNFYNKEAERGVLYNDPDLKINLNFPEKDLILSNKDLSLPLLKNAEI